MNPFGGGWVFWGVRLAGVIRVLRGIKCHGRRACRRFEAQRRRTRLCWGGRLFF